MGRKTASVALRSAIVAICVFLLCVISAVTVFGIPKRTAAEEADPALAEGVSQWDGDLIAAGWNDEVTTAPSTYDIDAGAKTIAIRDAAAFAWFAHEIYKDTANALDGYTVTLETDINLAGNMWIPIGQTDRQNALGKGNGQSRFSGTFDGGGHTIFNLDTTKLIAALQSGNLIYTYAGEKNYTNKTATVQLKTRSGEYSYGLFASAFYATVKNLNIDGINIDFSGWASEGGLTSDSIAAIIGYCSGDITVENCTVGANPYFENIIKASDGDGGLSSIVGRLYAYNDNTAGTDVKIIGCVNYANIETTAAKRRVGGIAGFLNYGEKITLDNCVNYGNVTGGENVGGIVGGWTPNANGSTKETEMYNFIIDCDNYGTVYSENATYIGGITGYYYRNTGNIKLIADGCNNYGNIGGGNFVGGLFADISVDLGNQNNYTVLVNNYNYGDVYSYNTGKGTVNGKDYGTCAGGYMAYMITSSSPTQLIVSGGNFGTIHGAATHKGQNFGLGENLITKKYFLIAGGDMVDTFDTETDIPASEYSEPAHNRYSDIVSRKLGADGDYVLSATYEFTYEYAKDYVNGGLAYADMDNQTTIIGYAGEGGAVEIPATVEKIAYGAFAGHSEITEITFANPSMRAAGELQIEDVAFAGTGIGTITLPSHITKIGAGAFGGIDNLNNVVLPSSADKIELGAGAFSDTRKGATQTYLGAYLIAKNNAQYWALRSSGKFDDYLSTLTHEITINFVNGGQTLGTETKLYGQGYKVSKDGGLWTAASDDDVKFGPTGYQDKQWLGADNSVYTAVNADSLLLTDADSITLTLFEPAAEGQKSFIARAGLVYDKNKSYSMAELNSLLHASSSQISADMTARIAKYNDSTDDLPDVIHNAGTYEISVEVPDDKTYTFTVTIAKATLDLSNLSNLEWNITQVGDTATSAQLMSYTLYIYNTANGLYPSRDIINASGYTLVETKYVDYSVARKRGEDATITIGIVGDGYSTASISGNTGNDVGAYTATANLTAGVNYVFTDGNVSKLRGMDITVTNSGATATVTKDWYIVDISNWLMGSGGSEYTMSGHIYGDTTYSVVAPALAFGTSDKITMHLFLDGVEVGDTSGFGVDRMPEYINYVMPAGNYTLRIDVAGLEAEDPEDQTMVWHNSFSETLSFTVEKAELPAAELEALINELTAHDQDNPYIYDVTDSQIFDGEAEDKVNALTGKTANLDRTGTAWENSDKYGPFIVEYNLSRWQNDSYYTSLNYDGNHALTPDTYTVYFRVSAPNYMSSTDGEDRFTYKFTLVKYEVLDAPTVSNAGLVYTGSRVLPDVVENSKYEILWNDPNGYVSGGEHSVSFRLYDEVHYRWKAGAGVDGNTVRVSYTVAAATNETIVSLNLVGWSFETYDTALNNIRFAVKFLDANEKIYFSVFKKGEATAYNSDLTDFTLVYDEELKMEVVSGAVLNALNSLPAGSYILKAKVNATANYKAFDPEPEVEFSITKANNSWAADKDSVVLPGWIVGEYNAKKNAIVVNPAHGTACIRVTDLSGKVVYFDSEKKINKLNECEVGRYLVTAWVNETDDFAELAPRTFTIEVFEKAGWPWWVTLVVTLGALGLAALIIFILWKKGVFQILTEKIAVAIRTRASIDATIAAVRAAKREDEAKKSVKAAEAKERAEARRLAALAEREKPAEERAAAIEAKAKLQAERAEKLRLRAERMQERAEKVRERGDKAKAIEVEVESAEAENAEAAATEDPNTED